MMWSLSATAKAFTWPRCPGFLDGTYKPPLFYELMARIREAIALCLEVEGEPAESLEFIGVQRVTIAA
jgi:hypothetical protein